MFRYLRNVQHTAMRAALLSLISLGTGSAETAGAVVLLLGRRSSDCGHGAPALYLAMELTTECIHAHVKVEQPVLNTRTSHVSTHAYSTRQPPDTHAHTRGGAAVCLRQVRTASYSGLPPFSMTCWTHGGTAGREELLFPDATDARDDPAVGGRTGRDPLRGRSRWADVDELDGALLPRGCDEPVAARDVTTLLLALQPSDEPLGALEPLALLLRTIFRAVPPLLALSPPPAPWFVLPPRLVAVDGREVGLARWRALGVAALGVAAFLLRPARFFFNLRPWRGPVPWPRAPCERLVAPPTAGRDRWWPASVGVGVSTGVGVGYGAASVNNRLPLDAASSGRCASDPSWSTLLRASSPWDPHKLPRATSSACATTAAWPGLEAPARRMLSLMAAYCCWLMRPSR